MRYLIILLMLVTTSVQAQPFDEEANAEYDIQSALSQSRDNGKFVLLEFGANW